MRKYNAASYLRIPPRTYTYLNYIPFQTRNQVKAALQMLAENRADEALKILEQSLLIYDSHVVRRYIGEICLLQGRMQEAKDQFDSVYDEFRFDATFLKNYESITNTLNQ